MFNEKNQACVSDLACCYRNHRSNWWKVILVDNNQRKSSLTVPSNCCEKLNFLAIVRPIIAFFFQTNQFDISDAGCVSIVLLRSRSVCIGRDIFDKMLVKVTDSDGHCSPSGPKKKPMFP